MKRDAILILLTLLITACGGPSTPTPDPAGTHYAVEETAPASITAQPPTATPRLPSPSAPAPTSTPANTATHRVLPSGAPYRSSTPTPGSTPTPQATTRSLDGMTLVYVPAGDFIMGSLLGEGSDEEAPLHTVTLDDFWIDRTEVTNAQYRAFVDASGHRTPTVCESGEPTYDDGAKANHPVVCVSWDDAQAYCAWAGGKLPTEAEWEKAARGTNRRNYPWGNSFDGSRANYCDAACESSQKDTATDDGYARTAPVGSYPAGVSPYGALDMAGNVWEWVSDWYNFSYYGRSPQSNPQGSHSGQYRVLRGGAWSGLASNTRSAFRAWLAPEKSDAAIGFRCVVPTP